MMMLFIAYILNIVTKKLFFSSSLAIQSKVYGHLQNTQEALAKVQILVIAWLRKLPSLSNICFVSSLFCHSQCVASTKSSAYSTNLKSFQFCSNILVPLTFSMPKFYCPFILNFHYCFIQCYGFALQLWVDLV